MAKRGRPRYPDILTPREWDVLALLREGLTNEQVAQRLGITERTVKFHVSEILSKLGVASRQQAASWQPEARGRPWWLAAAAPVAFLWRRAASGWLPAAAAGAVAVAVAAGVGALVWGLVRTEGERDARAVPAVPAATAGADGSAEPKVYRDEELGIEFEYPAFWVEGAEPMPYASCLGCAVFGPRDAPHPYGVQLITLDVDLAGPECGNRFGGCPVTALTGGIRVLPQGEESRFLLAGHSATRQEFVRQPPLGLTNETGETSVYRETWTVVQLNERGLALISFYRDDQDFRARAVAQAGYANVLDSLRFIDTVGLDEMTADLLKQPNVGDVLRAMEDRDVGALVELIDWQPWGCGTRATDACPDGTSPGTELPMVNWGFGDTFLVRQETLRPALEDVFAGEPLDLALVAQAVQTPLDHRGRQIGLGDVYYVAFEGTPRPVRPSVLWGNADTMTGVLLIVDSGAAQPVVELGSLSEGWSAEDYTRDALPDDYEVIAQP